MRSADHILGIIHERGTKGLPLEDIYRQLYNPALYLRAYARLYSNDGAMTKGTNDETVDGMSMRKIEQLINDLRHERHRWTPVRRTHIPKKNGKMRPLGLPAWTDKLLQEVLRSILEAYYEPQMSRHSHGFRPDRGCHSALSEIESTWTGTKWFLEGDITQCFDQLDHQILLNILSEKLHDKRLIRLIENLLGAGYMEEWTYHTTISGSPQGGVISPILSNIYLDKLDKYVEEKLLPAYNCKDARRRNKQYRGYMKQAQVAKENGRYDEAKKLRQQAQSMPSQDPNDPEYRRLLYVRYADDTLFGFAGPKAEVEDIKRRIGTFLQDNLKLELNQEKTLITHAATETARFLGYQIGVHLVNTKMDRFHRRNANARIGLRLPRDIVVKKCALYTRKGKSIHRATLLEDDDFTIISRYQSEYRGIVQYYLLAQNVCWFWKLHWDMQRSLLKTLAHKHKTTTAKILKQYQKTIETPHGTMKCLEIVIERENKKPLIARFGGIPLRRQKQITLQDQEVHFQETGRNELIKRLLAEICELCGSRKDIEVHHIRKLADLKKPGRKEKPAWIKIMAARRRKTLVVCRSCHNKIHTGTQNKVHG